MRRREGLIGLGLITGIGLSLCLVLAIQALTDGQSILCDVDESAVSCVRNWFNGVAILAGAATVFLLIREQTLAREVAILQTLDVRSKLVSAQRLSDGLKVLARRLRTISDEWPAEADTPEDSWVARRAARALIRAENTVGREIVREIVRFDIRIARKRTRAEKKLSEFLDEIVRPERLKKVRKNTRRNFAESITDDWYESVRPHHFVTLAAQLDDLAADIDRMAAQLLLFRGADFFEAQEALPPRPSFDM